MITLRLKNGDGLQQKKRRCVVDVRKRPSRAASSFNHLERMVARLMLEFLKRVKIY